MSHYGYLTHHGILGQKWGVRRYQNTDGSYTEAGKKRYSNKDSDLAAFSFAKKYEAIFDVNDKKNKAASVLGKDPKIFGNSKERQEYIESIQKTKSIFYEAKQITDNLLKKYKNVDSNVMTENKTGEQYVRSILTSPSGEIYISELYLGTHVK